MVSEKVVIETSGSGRAYAGSCITIEGRILRMTRDVKPGEAEIELAALIRVFTKNIKPIIVVSFRETYDGSALCSVRNVALSKATS